MRTLTAPSVLVIDELGCLPMDAASAHCTFRGARPSCHFTALVDDHCRFLLGIRAVPTKEAVAVLEMLAEAIELCGVPHELMTDDGIPFVTIVRTMLSRFQRTLAELDIRHIRTQVDTPWTNGKVESFWATLQAGVLDRQHLADLAAAEAAVTAFAGYYNYHRLHGALGWHTPAELFDGTVFTDRGFEHVPAFWTGGRSHLSASEHRGLEVHEFIELCPIAAHDR